MQTFMGKFDKIQAAFFLYPIFASLLSFYFKANAFFSILVFLALPSLVLSFLNKNLIKKSALFSAVLGIPLTIITDYLAETSGGWLFPESAFTFRLFGAVTIDGLVFGYLYVYFIIMYYEYFVNRKQKDELFYPNLKYLAIGCLTLFTLFLLIFIYNPLILKINYIYLKMGMILIILPVCAILLMRPNLVAKFFKAGLYFFWFSLIYEITALKLGQWTFPGKQYLGLISLFGVKFPLEELFFWIMLGAVSVISFYELFDNNKNNFFRFRNINKH
ncbi:hypothetical protein HYY71_07170 [Candidatus Woesearchaeota archaeon]|nr:hypothetical protein [Candidatus Woesearchaeota archaeon]